MLYNDSISGYKIYSCRPVGHYNGLELNKLYHNFTVSGDNLALLSIGQEISLHIEKDVTSKYEASYVVDMYGGIKFEGEINITPEQEFSFLCSMMSNGQATNIHRSYPNFCSLIINGKEGEIDVKKIKNVGKEYFKLYCKKIKNNLQTIKYCPVCNKWGIRNYQSIKSLASIYTTPELLETSLSEDPYTVFINNLDFSFKKADNLILEVAPELKESLTRCKAGCLSILKLNETETGDTRLNANLLARFVKELMPECNPFIVEAVKDNPLIHYDEATKDTALEQTYQDEVTIAKAIVERAKHPVNDCMEWEKFKNVTGFSCTDEQVEILRLASEESVAILTGSAGSGKSSAMKSLILMLEYYNKSYIQLSPTGTAAKRLRETTGRKAQTIHMFLASEAEGAMPDYVLVDEFSMCGCNLIAKLIRAVPKTAKLIFVCDNAQLASISCGNLVQDILDSGKVKRANLTKVFRYESSGLARIATDTRNGVNLDPSLQFDDYTFIKSGSDPVEQCLEQYAKYLSDGYSKQDIMILCPYNKSKIGSYIINERIQERFNANDFSGVEYKVGKYQTIRFRIGDRVINKKNNYHMPFMDYDKYDVLCERGEVFIANGDLGTIRDVGEEDGVKYLVVEFDCGLCKVSGQDITNLLLGYCISIHSSQGSQAKAVIVVIDESHSGLLSRNLMYVGLSRAQEKMALIADEDVVNEALEKEENMERETYLKELLDTQPNL